MNHAASAVMWVIAGALASALVATWPPVVQAALSFRRARPVLSTLTVCIAGAVLGAAIAGGLGRTLGRSAEPTPEQRASLKARATYLSQDILRFARERQEEDPRPIPRAESWATDTEKMIRYSAQTQALYSERYAVKVRALRDDLDALGIRDRELDSYYEHPTNILGLRALGERLGALAERL